MRRLLHARASEAPSCFTAWARAAGTSAAREDRCRPDVHRGCRRDARRQDHRDASRLRARPRRARSCDPARPSPSRKLPSSEASFLFLVLPLGRFGPRSSCSSRPSDPDEDLRFIECGIRSTRYWCSLPIFFAPATTSSPPNTRTRRDPTRRSARRVPALRANAPADIAGGAGRLGHRLVEDRLHRIGLRARQLGRGRRAGTAAFAASSAFSLANQLIGRFGRSRRKRRPRWPHLRRLRPRLPLPRPLRHWARRAATRQRRASEEWAGRSLRPQRKPARSRPGLSSLGSAFFASVSALAAMRMSVAPGEFQSGFGLP